MSSQPVNNIIGFTNGSVYEDIQLFLCQGDDNEDTFSEATKVKYRQNIEHFFSFLNKSDLTQLTFNDLHIQLQDVLRYRNYRRAQGDAASTINQRIAAMQSLYKFFSLCGYQTKHNINTEVFKIKRLHETPKKYGELSYDEALTMIHLVGKQRSKSLEKQLLIEFACKTGFREEDILSIEYEDFRYDEVDGYYYIEITEKKTKKFSSKALTPFFYNKLQQLKELDYRKRKPSNKLFTLDKSTIWEMMKALKKEMNIPESRNIVFHSFRGQPSNFIYDYTQGDIVAASRELNHSSIETTHKHYLNKHRDPSQMASVLMDEAIPDEVFDQLTHEEAIQLLKSIKFGGFGTRLKKDAVEILNSRM